MPFWASSGWTTSVNSRACRRSISRTFSEMPWSTCDGDRPSGPRASMRASSWSWTPATRTMKNSSRLVVKIARNFSALHQRQRLVLGELQHAIVEVEPRQLAVDVDRAASATAAAAASVVGVVPPRPSSIAVAASSSNRVLAHVTPTLALAIAAELGRSQQRDQLALRDGREAALLHPRLRPGEIVEQQRERRVVSDQQHVAEAGRQCLHVERLAGPGPLDRHRRRRAARTPAPRSAPPAASDCSGRRRGGTPSTASVRPRRQPAIPALGQRALVVREAVFRFGVAQKPEHAR